MKEVLTLNIDVSKLKEALGDTKNLKKLFDKIGFDIDNLDETNKKLEKQNKILNSTLKVLNLIKLAGKGLMWGAGLLGLSGYAITSAYRGAVGQSRAGRQVGLDLGGMKRWEYAEEQLGTDGSLLHFLSNVKYMLNDPTKQTPFASMGWNADEMKKMSPEELMSYMLDSIKEMGQKMPQSLLEENLAKMGFDLQSNWDILEDGAKNFKKYIDEAGGVLPRNYNQMAEGERAMNKFKNALNEIRLNIATKVVPILSLFVEKMQPLISLLSEKLGNAVEGVTNWLMEEAPNGKSNLENLIDTAIETLKNIWNGIQAIWKWLDENAHIFDGLKRLADWIAEKMGRSDKQKEKDEILKNQLKDFRGGFMGAWTKKFTDEEMASMRKNLVDSEKDMFWEDYYNRVSEFNRLLQSGSAGKGAYDKYHIPIELTAQGYKDRVRKVNDAIITKDGKIIQTNPQDNIIATKTGLSNNNTYNININATVRNDRDVNRIKMELGTLVNQLNMGGTI